MKLDRLVFVRHDTNVSPDTAGPTGAARSRSPGWSFGAPARGPQALLGLAAAKLGAPVGA